MSIKSGRSALAMILQTVLIFFLQLSTRAVARSNDEITLEACYGSENPLGHYEDAVRRIRDLLKTRTHLRGVQYGTEYHREGVDCYGRAWCRPRIPREDCKDCLRVVDDQITSVCPDPVWSLIGLEDCGMMIADKPITDD